MYLFPSFFHSLGILLGGANGTVPVQLKFMIEDPEALPAGDPELERFNAFALEFHDFAAGQADQVVMVGAFGVMLKTSHAVSELARGGPPAFGHHFQRAVHCGISDSRIPLPDLVVEFIHAQMGTRFHKRPRDLLTLPGRL
jgi:hypothetical protein